MKSNTKLITDHNIKTSFNKLNYNIKTSFNKLNSNDNDLIYDGIFEISLYLYANNKLNMSVGTITFNELLNWQSSSARSGVWTYYEVAKMENMIITKNYLKDNKNVDIYDIYSYGIHDYNNASDNDINKWVDESDIIDDRLNRNEILVMNYLKNLLFILEKEILNI